MKKLACFAVVLLFVTVALGERDQCGADLPERWALSVEYFEIYLEEHPDLSQEQRQVIIGFKGIFEVLPNLDQEDPKVQQFGEAIAEMLHRELLIFFGVPESRRIFDGLEEYSG